MSRKIYLSRAMQSYGLSAPDLRCYSWMCGMCGISTGTLHLGNLRLGHLSIRGVEQRSSSSKRVCHHMSIGLHGCCLVYFELAWSVLSPFFYGRDKLGCIIQTALTCHLVQQICLKDNAVFSEEPFPLRHGGMIRDHAIGP
jgi:hypothetical protein